MVAMVIQLNDRNDLATLLRRAATQTIPETDFWIEFKAISARVKDPVVEVASESAIHYWGNFHARSIFFLIPVKPDRGQVQQGKNELNLIADGLDAGWELTVIEEKLKAI
jgi:hypothetical protein